MSVPYAAPAVCSTQAWDIRTVALVACRVGIGDYEWAERVCRYGFGGGVLGRVAVDGAGEFVVASVEEADGGEAIRKAEHIL